MTHLVFLPRPRFAPRLFLWGRDRGRPRGIEGFALLGRQATATVVTDRLRAKRVSGFGIPLLEGVAALAALDASDLKRMPASVAGWSLAAKLALDLVARERLVPLGREVRRGAEARWGVSLSLPHDAERFGRPARTLPPAALTPRLAGAGRGLRSGPPMRSSRSS